ncbi:MAG: hypothetical protein ACUVUF_07880 [Candidatus Bathycorpusculaceae bacterium]
MKKKNKKRIKAEAEVLFGMAIVTTMFTVMLLAMCFTSTNLSVMGLILSAFVGMISFGLWIWLICKIIEGMD